MIYYKTQAEVELIRESCILVCKTLAHVGSLLKPGAKGIDIDREAEKFIRDHHAVPAFKGYGRDGKDVFPFTLCWSINEAVVHGFPSERELQDGDIVSVDCGVALNGYFGDAAYTFAVGEVPKDVMQLLVATKKSLNQAVEVAIVGKRIGDIGFAVQDYTERKHNYSVVRDLVGHGIGKDLHEDPQVANHGKRGNGVVLRDGLVIAIEPMINMGKKEVVTLSDRWTIIAKDKKPSAHYEHTVVVRKDKADVLSDHSFIEKAIKNNPEIKEISINN